MFYVIATKFGAWAPQELNYEESVNTLFPWISGAAIGLLASTNEEFTFRLFRDPLFQEVHEIDMDRRHRPGISVGIFAQQLSAGAGLHARN